MEPCPELRLWKEQVTTFLPRSCVKHTADIRADIIAVDMRVKLSFLFDYCCTTSSALSRLVARLRELRLVQSCSLIVIDVEETLFIACQDLVQWATTQLVFSVLRLIEVYDTSDHAVNDSIIKDPVFSDPVHGDPILSDPVHSDPVVGDPVSSDPVPGDPILGDRVHSDSVLFNPVHSDLVINNLVIIDVSKHLNHPKILDNIQARLVTRPIIASLRNALKNLTPSSAQQACLNVTLTSSVNRTTMFGLLLGYPILYWYATDLTDPTGSSGDCLGYVPLCVNKASISLPCSYCRQQRINAKTGCTFSVGQSCSRCCSFKTVYSFSFPEELSNECLSAVCLWKRAVSRAVEVCGDGLLVKFDNESVTLPVVAM